MRDLNLGTVPKLRWRGWHQGEAICPCPSSPNASRHHARRLLENFERNYVAHDTDREQRQDLARTHDLGEGAVTHQGDVHAPVKPERPDQLFV